MPGESGADPIAVGRLAVKRGLLDEADLKSAVQELAQLTFERVKQGAGAELPRLADVLIERKLLNREQVLELETDLAAAESSTTVTPRRQESLPSDAESTKKQVTSASPEQFESTKRQPSPLAASAHTVQRPTPGMGVSSASKPPAGSNVRAISVGGTSSAITRRSFGKYMLVKEIGRGGMSVVWEGYDTDLRRRVAIKFLTGVGGRYIDAAQEEILKRFYREAHSAAKLNHPNIVKIYEVGELDGQHYIAMEYIDGETLYELTRKRAMERLAVVRALRDSAFALDHAHKNGILHRDIKPQNIMIDKAGHTYIMDFGLARDLREDERLTLSGIAIGTPNYMPPEHAQGSRNVIDVRSDVYSLGAVLYEMLAGRPPFPGDTPMAVMMAVVNQDPERPSQIRRGVPGDLEKVCLKAMEKDKERRYPTAHAMGEDLDRYLRGEPVLARRGSLLHRVRRRAMRSKVAIVAGVALVALAGWIFFMVRGWRDRQETVRQQLARARELRDLGDFSAAAGVAESVLRIDAGSKEARELLEEVRRRKAAQEEAKRREEERKTKAEEEFVAGNNAYKNGDLDEALAGFTRALELDPDHVEALHQRGHLHFRQQRDEAALADWLRVHKLSPKHVDVTRDLGDLHRRKGDAEAARDYYGQALAINPKFADVHHSLAHMLWDEGNLDEAEETFTAALEAHESGEYYADRADVRAQKYCKGGHGDAPLLKSAMADAERALSMQKGWKTFAARARCHYEAKEFDSAVADYRQALKLDPPNRAFLQRMLEQALQKTKAPH